MKNRHKPIQPTDSVSGKPAKERILEESDALFRILGVRVSPYTIAHQANSNFDTVLKHFGHPERLISIFLNSLIQRAENYWNEVERERPDAEARLRYWMFYEQGRSDDPYGPERLLARSAAEFGGRPNNPLLAEIEQYWQAERRRVVRLCEAAGFREPRELADKLLLLVHGLRNERGAYGHHAPSRLLHQAADDLMVAHGATRKALLSWDDD